MSIFGVFWSVFSRIRTEYGEIRSISPVRIRENTDLKNSNTDTFHAVSVIYSENQIRIGGMTSYLNICSGRIGKKCAPISLMVLVKNSFVG